MQWLSPPDQDNQRVEIFYADSPKPKLVVIELGHKVTYWGTAHLTSENIGAWRERIKEQCDDLENICLEGNMELLKEFFDSDPDFEEGNETVELNVDLDDADEMYDELIKRGFVVKAQGYSFGGFIKPPRNFLLTKENGQ
jgi:hypothetical protein